MAVYKIPLPPGVEIVDELQPGRAFTVAKMPQRAELQKWSASVSGSVYAGDGYFTHTAGHRSEVYILHSVTDPSTGEVTEFIPKILSAREATQKLLGVESVGWTYSQMARSINTWLNIYQLPLRSFKQLIPTWHYQSCRAGVYEHAAMYDMTSAYWQTVARVPTPRVRIKDGKLQFLPIAVEQRRRWDKLLKVFSDPTQHKALRLTLVGVNAAGWKPARDFGFPGTVGFSKGKELPHRNLHGALQPLALYAVRCTYELCQIQAEMSDAIYANADCIMTERFEAPQYWEALGVVYRKQAEGTAILCRQGSYSVGHKTTAPFARDAKYAVKFSSKAQRLENPDLHLAVWSHL